MEQKFINFTKDETMLDAKTIEGVYTETASGIEKVIIEVGDYTHSESYELVEYSYKEVIEAIVDRVHHNSVYMEI